jgi:hypothetical protein
MKTAIGMAFGGCIAASTSKTITSRWLGGLHAFRISCIWAVSDWRLPGIGFLAQRRHPT